MKVVIIPEECDHIFSIPPRDLPAIKENQNDIAIAGDLTVHNLEISGHELVNILLCLINRKTVLVSNNLQEKNGSLKRLVYHCMFILTWFSAILFSTKLRKT
ncbi:hypothetical protein IGI04_007249, partial [Brassica rapa subsp. trilocularis]